MEANGKRVSVDGEPLNYDCTVINFGEPGTNGTPPPRSNPLPQIYLHTNRIT